MLVKPVEQSDRRRIPNTMRGYQAEAHERLRFRVLTVIALLKLLNLFGGIWDIQWHVAIGRDSLWIPPHLLVIVAFVSGMCLVSWMLVHETHLTRSGVKLEGTVHLGPIHAPLGFFGVFFGYAAALLSGGFDELWHEVLGVDVTLWSPPHLAIMFSTMVVDYSLLIGLVESGRRRELKFAWTGPFLWVFVLVGAYTFEAVNFQMAQAFIVSFAAQSAGVVRLLFPVLVGSLFPMSLLLIIGLARRFWPASLIFVTALGLQYIGVGVAAVGFAALRPVSVVEEFVRLNPDSTIALARQWPDRFRAGLDDDALGRAAGVGVALGLVAVGQAQSPDRRPCIRSRPRRHGERMVPPDTHAQRIPHRLVPCRPRHGDRCEPGASLRPDRVRTGASGDETFRLDAGRVLRA